MVSRPPTATLIRHLQRIKSGQQSCAHRSIQTLTPLIRCPRRSHLPRPHARHQRLPFSTVASSLEDPKPDHTNPNTSSSPDPAKKIKTYTTADIITLISNPSSSRVLIDVREPSELSSTGRIPTAINLPLKTGPDFPFLSESEFEDRFGMPRPDQETEVVFYCRSGVRSHIAAELAVKGGFGGKVAEYPESWLGWEKEGGKVAGGKSESGS